MTYKRCAEEKSLVPGCFLVANSLTFEVQSILGEGVFAKVYKCVRFGGTTPFAIKVFKKTHNCHEDAKAELKNLAKLKILDHDKCNIIRVHGAFFAHGCHCMVFEHLDRSLGDLIRELPFSRLHLNQIRLIVWQLAIALKALNAVGLTHTDIKMDNIMLVNQNKYPFKIKLIDFGLATEMSSLRRNLLVQPLGYRAPEVMLGLPLTEAIDIWSLGCLAARLYLGRQLYSEVTEFEMMRCIVETQGQPPDHVLDAGVKTHRFFKRCSKTSWKLKTENCKQAEKQAANPLMMKLESLDDILIAFPTTDEEKLDLALFVVLLKKMLHLEPAKRITPQKILKHRFVTSLIIQVKTTKKCFLKVEKL